MSRWTRAQELPSNSRLKQGHFGSIAWLRHGRAVVVYGPPEHFGAPNSTRVVGSEFLTRLQPGLTSPGSYQLVRTWAVQTSPGLRRQCGTAVRGSSANIGPVGPVHMRLVTSSRSCAQSWDALVATRLCASADSYGALRPREFTAPGTKKQPLTPPCGVDRALFVSKHPTGQLAVSASPTEPRRLLACAAPARC
eukprot:361613-Chlamydomonas_euryale.AAC.4